MRKVYFIGMCVIMFLITLYSALALNCPQGYICQVIEKPTGVMPDSPFYIIDVFIDNLRYDLAPVTKKAEVFADIEQERALEMQEMARLNKLKSLNKAITEHNRFIEQAKTTIPNLEEKIQHHIEILENVKEKLEAMNKTMAITHIDNAINRSSKVLEHIEKAKEIREEVMKGKELEIKIESKNDKTHVKIEAGESELELDIPSNKVDKIVSTIKDKTGISKEVIRRKIAVPVMIENKSVQPVTTSTQPEQSKTEGLYPIPTSEGEAPTGHFG